MLILNYDIFQEVTSLLDTVLSPFLHTVVDGFGDNWTNAGYLLADSFFQLVDSLRDYLSLLFPLSNPIRKSWGMKGLATELTI